MRCLLISTSTSLHRPGGVEVHLDALIEILRSLGAEAHVLTTRLPEGKNFANPRVHAVDAPPAYFGPRWWIESRRAYCGLQKTFEFDWLISEGYSAAAIAGVPERPPLAAFLHGFEPEHAMNEWHEASRPFGLARYFLINLPEVAAHTLIEWNFCRRADKIWTVADHIRERAVKFYGIAPERCSTVHNWLSNSFDRAGLQRERGHLRAEWGVAENATVFAFSGALNRQKGARAALRAFMAHAAREPNSHLVIIGGGEEQSVLASLAARAAASRRIHFLGRRPHDEVPRLLAAADVYLMPTLRHEGLPYAALEAARLGLPVIASGRAGVREAVGPDGIYVDPHNPAELVQAMDAAARMEKSERRALGEKIRGRSIELFSEKSAARFLSETMGARP